MNREELQDYVRISVEAVGGLTTEPGQLMKQMLLEREAVDARPAPIADVVEEPNDGLLPAGLEQAFQENVAK